MRLIYASALCAVVLVVSLNAWGQAIVKYGPLQPRLARLCIRTLFHSQPFLTMGQCVIPSPHEQLEARFELHEWGRQHLPADVLAELERFEG